MIRASNIRQAARLAAVTAAASVGGVASPAQASPPSTACVYVLRMHNVFVQRANASAHVAAPSMIWATTASAAWYEAVWENMRAAAGWTDVATRLGCHPGARYRCHRYRARTATNGRPVGLSRAQRQTGHVPSGEVSSPFGCGAGPESWRRWPPEQIS